ncbi:alpha/beta hydrolase [Variovorax ginsengisoli]|uniref:Carboxylesterase n=1 Tax=Variovorax ginsengisoli TaxID=363844 RepID=A0ABT9S5N2_9BURK|nr:alpha/beta fold hydrolase [Variovorax ginsengisoli]MDP9899668.1 carboxylesterase [Variovorax ginsengisoli]
MSAFHGSAEALRVDHSAARRTAVVLLHGLCSTPDELRTVGNALRGLGYTVQALPIEGYSFDATAEHQAACPFEHWVDTLEHRVDALRANHDRVLLVGISAGASLALAAAIRCGTRIDALLLMSTALRLDGWAVPRTQWLLPLALYTPLGRFWKYRERAPYGVKNERVRAWIERELRTRRISSAGSSVIGIDHLREHHRLLRHVRANLQRVQCANVLALHARDDEVASLQNLAILARDLRCGSLRTVVLSNSFHMITIDNDRQQVLAETLEFAAAIACGTA